MLNFKISTVRSSAVKPMRIMMLAATMAVFASGFGCANQNAPGGGKEVSTPTPNPATQPLPSNIPADQQAQIRQQQQDAYNQAQQFAKQHEPKAATH